MAVYKADILDIELNTGNIARSFLCHNIGKDDTKADRFGVRVYRDGEPESLSGCSIQGYMMRPNGTNLAITGSNTGVSGNEAWVDLPQAAYDYEGQFCLALKLIGGGVTGTIRIIDGMINNTFVDDALVPMQSVPTYQEILAVYDQMVAAKNGSVRFDQSQSLTETQKSVARMNIDAASDSDVADLKSAITPLVTLNELIPYTNGAYILCNQDTGETVSLTPVSDSSWQYAIVDCSAGDKFYINSQGANSARAWAFIDASNVMIDKATSGVIDATIVAPTNAAKLIINNKAQGGAAYKVTGGGGFEALQNIVNDLSGTVESDTTSRINFLALEQGAFYTQDGDYLDTQNYVRTITKITNPMHIDTLRSDIVIANAFTFNVSDDSFVSYTAIGARSADITPEAGKYIRLTFRRNNETAIKPEDIQPDLFVTTMTRKSVDIDSNTLALTTKEHIKSLFVYGAYINNSGSTGSIINPTPVSNPSYAYIIYPCRVGDVFTLTGTGGGAQRLYSFTDERYKKVKGIGQNATLTAESLVANFNGYFIANVQITSDFDLYVTHRIGVASAVESIKGITTDYSSLFVQRYSITTNGAIGESVSIEPQTNDAYAYVIVPCFVGDQFTLTATGGTTARVWCFVDKDYKKVKAASVVEVSGLALTAEKDGYLIVNAMRSYGYSLVKVGLFDPSIVQSLFNSLDVGFILPKNFYGIAGNQLYWYTPEMFSNWRHLLNYEVVTTNVPGVQSIEDSVAPRMIVPLQTRRLNIRLHDYANNEDEEKFIELKTTAPVASSSASVLVIGDSFIKYTWGAGVLKYISDFAAVDNVTLNFVGTTTTGYGYHAEARGGWSAVDYLTHYVPVAERDSSATDEQKKMPSPFVFSDNDTVADAYFDFAKYLTVNNMTAPDIIMISLGMNGGDTSAAAIQEMITDIHADYPNIKIIVSMIPTVPRRIESGDFYTRKTSRENQNLSYIALFDKRDAEKIYLSSEHLAIDGILGLGGTEQNVNPVSFDDSDKVMEIVNNSIHPTAIGAWNLAKFKYNAIVYVMNVT